MIAAIMSVHPHDRRAPGSGYARCAQRGVVGRRDAAAEGWDLDGSIAAAWSYAPGSGLDLAVIQHLVLPDATIYQLRAFKDLRSASR